MPTQKTTIKMPSFSGGVAKTAPSKRRPDQVEEADNVFLSLERSSEKRHGTTFVQSDSRTGGDLNITEPTAGELVIENFRLDKDNSIFVVINPAAAAANIVQLFNMQTGNKITASSLNDTNGNMTKLKTYLNIGSGAYSDKIKVLRVQDSLVILNTEAEAKFKLTDEGQELTYEALDRFTSRFAGNFAGTTSKTLLFNGTPPFEGTASPFMYHGADDASQDSSADDRRFYEYNFSNALNIRQALGRKIYKADTGVNQAATGTNSTPADTAPDVGDIDRTEYPYGLFPLYKLISRYDSRFTQTNFSRSGGTISETEQGKIDYWEEFGYVPSDNRDRTYNATFASIADNQNSVSVGKYSDLGGSPDALRFSTSISSSFIEGITTSNWPVTRTPFVRNKSAVRNAMKALHSEGVDDVTWVFRDGESLDYKQRFGAYYLLGNPADGDGFIFNIREKSGPFPSGFYRTISTPIDYDLYGGEEGKIIERFKRKGVEDDADADHGVPVYQEITPTPAPRIADTNAYPEFTLTNFQGAAPYYQRIRTPELGSVFDRTTMPHLIAWNGSVSSPDFLVSESPWTPRLSGNKFNNPGPSFISLSEKPYDISAKAASLELITADEGNDYFGFSSLLGTSEKSKLATRYTTNNTNHAYGLSDNATIQLIDAESSPTTKTYKQVSIYDMDETPPSNTVYFYHGENGHEWACNFKDAVEGSSGHNGTILVDIEHYPKIVLTQKSTGTQGNTTVTLGADMLDVTNNAPDYKNSVLALDPGNFTGGEGTINQAPTNTGGKISAIGYWENRLWMASGNTIVSSQRNNPYNLWFDDGDTPTDDDPIDLSLSETDATKIQWIVPFASSCFLGTDGTQQFVLSGAEDYISPSTIVLSKATEYSTSATAKPLNIGESLYFVDNGRLFVYNKTKNGREYSYSVSEPVFGYFPTNVTQTLLVPSNDYALFTTNDTDKENHIYVFHQRLLPDGNIGQQAFYRWIYGENDSSAPEIKNISNTGDNLHILTKENNKYFVQTMSMSRVLETDILLDKKQVVSSATSTNGGNTQWLIPYVTTTASIVRHTNNFVPLTGLTYTDNGNGTTTIQQSGTTYASEPVTIGEPFTMKLELSPFILRDENSTHIDSLVQIKSINVRHHKTGKYEIDVTRRGRTNKKSDLLFDPSRTSNALITINDADTSTPLHTQKNGQFNARIAANADDVEIILKSTYHAPVNLTNVEAQVDANIGVNVSIE
jgi:hypothetical protein